MVGLGLFVKMPDISSVKASVGLQILETLINRVKLIDSSMVSRYDNQLFMEMGEWLV